MYFNHKIFKRFDNQTKNQDLKKKDKSKMHNTLGDERSGIDYIQTGSSSPVNAMQGIKIITTCLDKTCLSYISARD